MGLFRWLFGHPRPRGLHHGEPAARWAEVYFAEPMQPVAAYVVELLCEHSGAKLSRIEPATTFVGDLGMDDLEPVEFLIALEEGLSLVIAEEDGGRLQTVGALIEYLYQRLAQRKPSES